MRCCKGLRAEISVFAALTVTVIFALLMSLLESAQTASARLSFAQASDAAMDSLFSQYHKKLWTEYRLLGLEHYEDVQLTDEFTKFIKPYMEATGGQPMKTESVRVAGKQSLTDDNGLVFEKEVLDYMKYGIAVSLMNELEITDIIKSVKEAAAASQTAGIYEGNAKSCVRLEGRLEAVAKCLEEQEKLYTDAAECLSREDGDGFRQAAGRLILLLTDLPRFVDGYTQAADELKGELLESRRRYEEIEAEGDLSEGTRAYLEADIEKYESYILEDGSRRQEIESFKGRAEENISFLQDMLEAVEDLEEEIADWHRNHSGFDEEDEEEEPDWSAYWDALAGEFHGYDLLRMECQRGVADKEKEKCLEKIRELFNGELLKLVLPEGAEVSKEALPLEKSPTAECYFGDNIPCSSMMDRLYITQYETEMMNYFGRGIYDQNRKKKGSGNAELEYLLQGKESDRENLSAQVRELISIRAGLNLVFLYSNAEKRSEAETLAAAVTGIFGFAPLTGVMTFFILSIWSLGQAICDIRDLLAGKKVPLLHSEESWYLDLEGLLAMGASEGGMPEHGEGSGFLYADYLRFLLFMRQGSETDYRCMDMIQMNLRKGQFDFTMEKLAQSLDMSVEASAAHLFLFSGSGGSIGKQYRMSMVTSYAY